MIPAVGGIIIADYFFVRKRKYESLKEANFKVINYKAIGACILGILAGKYLTVGIPSINSLIITGVIHIILEKAIKEKTQKMYSVMSTLLNIKMIFSDINKRVNIC